MADEGLYIRERDYETFTPDPYELPYIDIASQILVRGPLGRALDRRNIGTRAIEVERETAPAPATGTMRWTVGAPGAKTYLAARFGALSPEHRGVVRRAGEYLVAPDAAVARAVAAALGTRAAERRVEGEPSEMHLVSVRRDAELLRSPGRDSESLASLERGTILVTPTSLDSSERYWRVVVHEGLVGFIDRRRLETDDVCAPALAPFLAGFDTGERTALAVRTRRVALSSGSWGRATFIAETDETSHIELRRMGAECAVDRSLLRYTRPGTVRSLSTTRTQRRGGESLIVTVTSEPSVSIHRYGNAEPLFTRALTSGREVAVSESEEDAWFPVVITGGESPPVRIAWTDEGPAVAP